MKEFLASLIDLSFASRFLNVGAMAVAIGPF